MSLNDVLTFLFPDAKTGDWVLQYDGGDELPFIAEWNRSEPKPTAQQLKEAELPTAKAIKWAAIKAARDAAEFGAFEYDGMIFDGNEKSKSRINGAVLTATLASISQQPYSVEWTLADNTSVTFDGAQMIAFGLAAGRHVADAFDQGRELREQLENAQTIEELNNIQWNI